MRLVEHNRERFAKRILAGSKAGRTPRPRPRCGRRHRASPAGDGLLAGGRDDYRAVLARTTRELLVAVVAALDLGVPFRAPDLPLAIEDPRLDGLLDRAGAEAVARTGAAR